MFKYIVDHVFAWGRDIYAVREIDTRSTPHHCRTLARCDVEADAQAIVSALTKVQPFEQLPLFPEK